MSLRTKLFLSYAAVSLLALVLAGTAFVALRWREQQRAALDRLAVAAPQITLDVFRLQRQGIAPEAIGEYLREEARRQGVRILLVDRNGVVTQDSDDSLRGKTLNLPVETSGPPKFGYRVWRGQEPEQGSLIFLAPTLTLMERRVGPTRIPPTDAVVLAIPRQTLAGAWRGLLPGLGWAGLTALILSAVVAGLLARSISHPLQALTRASEEMARGNYDQEIPLARNDEVGRLAKAFNEMARQVGRSHLQMRALIANVSHDLKTPLTSILGFAQALRDRAVEDPQAVAETGGIIHDEAERMRSLVEDLLFLSEIEAGQVVVAREPVDLGLLAARAARRFEPSLAERRVMLRLAVPEGLVVQGDSAKLERILDNLLDNARKYTPDGGRVEVRAALAPEPTRAVRLEVFNTGSYIPPEDLPRVFDRFVRLDRTRAPAHARGSGLGLAIAKELAELHGGTLTAASDSSGTTFTLTLPLPAPAPRARTPGAVPAVRPHPRHA
jgi:signal transduction histidine kinase